MDEIVFKIILFLAVLIPIAFCVWLIYILYSIPKKNGQKITGLILSSIVGLFFIYIVFSMFFEDKLFSKDEAKNLLEKQNIILNDDFEISENKSISGIGDYYHTFTLKISEADKTKIVMEIGNNSNSIVDEKSVPEITELTDRHFGQKVIQNYETKDKYVRKTFQPNGKDNAPTYQVVTVEKSKNEIIFEDIDE